MTRPRTRAGRAGTSFGVIVVLMVAMAACGGEDPAVGGSVNTTQTTAQVQPSTTSSAPTTSTTVEATTSTPETTTTTAATTITIACPPPPFEARTISISTEYVTDGTAFGLDVLVTALVEINTFGPAAIQDARLTAFVGNPMDGGTGWGGLSFRGVRPDGSLEFGGRVFAKPMLGEQYPAGPPVRLSSLEGFGFWGGEWANCDPFAFSISSVN